LAKPLKVIEDIDHAFTRVTAPLPSAANGLNWYQVTPLAWYIETTVDYTKMGYYDWSLL
jgi:hypothetical protein